MNPYYTDSGWVVKTERRKYKTNKAIKRIMSHLERKKKRTFLPHEMPTPVISVL